MSFTINQTGIESGATQVIFETPVVISNRDEESAADAVYDISLSRTPICVVYVADQAKTFLRLYVRRLLAADVATLRTLMASGTSVVVKLTPGSLATIDCMFGPRSEQSIAPWNGDHPDADALGAALDPLLTQYYANLFLLRL